VTAVVCDVVADDVAVRETPSFFGAAAVRFTEELDDVS
jgi:hypothetical protein